MQALPQPDGPDQGARDEGLATAAHDLRAALAVIAGTADTLAVRWSLLSDEDRLDFLTALTSASRRLAGDVETFLSLARPEAVA